MPKGIYKRKPLTKTHRENISIAKQGFHPVTEFKKGHHPKTEFQKGSKHPFWKEGRRKDGDGYILILKPEHPFCDNLGYVREYRLVVEQQIGRYLKPEERVHHMGIKYSLKTIENRQDNRPENLMAFTSISAHRRFHGNPNNVKLEEIIFDGRKLKEEK